MALRIREYAALISDTLDAPLPFPIGIDMASNIRSSKQVSVTFSPLPFRQQSKLDRQLPHNPMLVTGSIAIMPTAQRAERPAWGSYWWAG